MPLSMVSSHFTNYLATIGGDSRTKTSVESIIGRMNELLEDRPDGRLSGLVVGRVQSGKTRNYVGLALKAADEGWNVIIVLTSCNTALADQTEKRMKRDFGKAGVRKRHAFRLNLLENVHNEDADDLTEPGYFFWGVAMKERRSLDRIGEWLAANRKYQPNMRVLVIDDEADNASQNSNAGADSSVADAEKVVADASEEMRECREEPFDTLADWLDGLVEMEFPDEAAETPDAKALARLKTALNGRNNGAAVLSVAVDDAEIRNMLGLDQPADEAQGEYGERLAAKARRYFNAQSGSSPRSASSFAKVLKAVFEIVEDRSTINKKILSLVDRADDMATEYTYPFARCAYIAYTATPYACILNERPGQTKMYPDFIYSLEKSPKYFGLDEIFGRNLDSALTHMGIVRSITEKEEDAVVRQLQGVKPRKDGTKELKRIDPDLTCHTDRYDPFVWESLKNAVNWAFCCAAARRWNRINISVPEIMATEMDEDERRERLDAIADRWTTMLFNISQKTSVHKCTREILSNYINFRLKDDESRIAFASECRALWEKETGDFTVEKFNALFNDGRDNGEKYGHVDSPLPWETIADDFDWFLHQGNFDVLVINSLDKENQSYYTQTPDSHDGKIAKGTIEGDHLWFVCGGNTIARGLTLEGLVSSYFDRVKTKSVAVDTMTQMGRWFGYRIGYELLPRVWMTPYSVKAFKETGIIEETMHGSMAENFANRVSPRDEATYQMVYCCGRRLSGRDHAKCKHDTGVGTYASTKDISVVREDVEKIIERTRRFLSDIADKASIDRKCEEDGCEDPGPGPKTEYMYAKVPLWRNVEKANVEKFLMDLLENSPEATRRILRGLVRELARAEGDGKGQLWDVVLAEPQYGAYESRKIEPVDLGGARRVKVGTPTPETCANGVAHYSSPIVHIPYYANIPTKFLTQVDYENFRELHDRPGKSVIVQRIVSMMGKDGWDAFAAKLAPFLGEGLKEENAKERIDAFLEKHDPKPIDGDVRGAGCVPERGPMPEEMRWFLNDRSNEYRNRSSSRYMETAHKRAGEMKPMLQIYPIEPPPEANLGQTPLVAFSVYWPGHAPDRFYAMTTSTEPPPSTPKRKEFYAAVEAVLKEWHFPMATRRLRNAVMDRLGPGCTAEFFDANIAKIPEGRNYEPVPGHNAYMPKGWDEVTPFEARMAFALCEAAINLLRRDNNGHVSRDVFKKVLEDPKLGDFFSAGNTNDYAYFNSLLTDKMLASNGIEKTSGRPITFRYLG